VLAPFNTNELSGQEFIESIKPLVVRRGIKFSSKLREVDRQYERDNNSKIDNGIYVRSTAFKEPIKSTPFMSRAASNQVDGKALEEMERMGFERGFVKESLEKNMHNSATTCYYLLTED